ncbi:MAG: FAD-dependent oxidoreductase [Myxococcota bacterium]|nr:FAD-dependent oxidoreductase [Myxococcota bacterium]
MSDLSKGRAGEPVRLHISGLERRLEESEEILRERAAERLGVPGDALLEIELLKRSLDARGEPSFIYSVEVALEKSARFDEQANVELPREVRFAPPPGSLSPREFHPRRKPRVVIIGAGPSGLFCAHRLAQSGVYPILLDRGQPVEIRGKHVSRLMHHGELREHSNICFGEGGAGTWSDGKLYTRVKDIRVRHILETIVALGGPERILVDGKPHLGTDKLVALCKAFRAELMDLGCEVRFGAMVERLAFSSVNGEERCTGVILDDGEKIDADRVILAVGHSARELYLHLADSKVFMERKPFAVGFRVEHPQALINEIQYGKWATHEGLPTADYRLTANFGSGENHRGVYSFCMCPGGQVVPSATRPGHVCVNGMSHASRKGHWANSALVVSLSPDEFESFGDHERAGVPEVLAGMVFQEEAERRAYDLGGGGFIAPAQRLEDFRKGVASKDVRKTTYKPGIAPGNLETVYPPFIIEALRAALARFEKRMRGFLTNDALLIGVETRTSAPIRIVRDDETLQSISMPGLYPCGEGSGYGGGIVSAALDGLRIAERILEEASA